MPIISIKRDYGVAPSGIRITSTDSLAAVQVAGYMTAQAPFIRSINGGPFGFVPGDMIFMAAFDGDEIFTFVGNDFTTLVPNAGGGGGSVTPQQVQQSAFNTGTDIGVADAYIVNLNPAVTAYTDGLLVSFSPLNSNLTVTPTLQINGLLPQPIVLPNGDNGLAGDLVANVTAFFLYVNNNQGFMLLNPQVSYVFAEAVQGNFYNNGTDVGVADAYVVNNSFQPNDTASLEPGCIVTFLPSHTNLTTTPTLQFNGASNFGTITDLTGNPLLPGALNVNCRAMCVLAVGGQWGLINPFVTNSGVTPTQVQQSAFNTAPDTGIADAYVVSISPVPASLTNGMTVAFIPNFQNATTTPTLDVGLGPSAILLGSTPYTLQPLDIVAGSIAYVIWNNGAWLLLNPLVSYVTPVQVQQSAFNYGVDTGIADAYVVNLTPAVTSLTDGFQVTFSAAHQNATTSPTLQINALTPVPIVTWNAASLQVADIADTHTVTQTYIYNLANNEFQLMNPQLSIIYPFNLTANTWIKSTDSGIVNAYIANPQFVPGFVGDGFVQILTSIQVTNLGASTLTLGLNTSPIVRPTGAALTGGEIVAGNTYMLMYSVTAWILMNSSV